MKQSQQPNDRYVACINKPDCIIADSKPIKVKVLLLYSTTQLNQMVSVALYNLTPGRGLTQPLVWAIALRWSEQVGSLHPRQG